MQQIIQEGCVVGFFLFIYFDLFGFKDYYYETQDTFKSIRKAFLLFIYLF